MDVSLLHVIYLVIVLAVIGFVVFLALELKRKDKSYLEFFQDVNGQLSSTRMNCAIMMFVGIGLLLLDVLMPEKSLEFEIYILIFGYAFGSKYMGKRGEKYIPDLTDKLLDSRKTKYNSESTGYPIVAGSDLPDPPEGYPDEQQS